MVPVETRLTENFKKCIWMWFFLRFQLSCHQSYRLNFFQQGLRGELHLFVKLLDRHIPKSFPWNRTLVGWNWQKCDLLRLFSIVQLISSKSTGWISRNKISQYSFRISKGDSEEYLGFRTFYFGALISRNSKNCGNHSWNWCLWKTFEN